MNEIDEEFYKKREDAFILYEDNELALIEISVKKELVTQFLSLISNVTKISETMDLALFFKFFEEKLQLRTSLEMEHLNERIQRENVKTRVEVLWEI